MAESHPVALDDASSPAAPRLTVSDSEAPVASAEDRAARTRTWRVAMLVVAAAALLAYAATVTFEFVWDDTLLIQRSYQLHQWRDLWPALTSHFWAEVQESSHYYR